MKKNTYSAGMTSKVFAFIESKIIAEFMVDGMIKKDIEREVISNNLFQLKSEYRLKRTFNYVYDRLNSLPEGCIELLINLDNDNSKLLVLLGIMCSDRLFFEFVYEVYRHRIMSGDKTLDNRYIDDFFDEKIKQSEVVARWSETSIKKLKSTYVKNLVEAGLIQSSKNRVINHVLVNYKIEEIFNNNNIDVYINAIKGV